MSLILPPNFFPFTFPIFYLSRHRYACIFVFAVDEILFTTEASLGHMVLQIFL